MRLFIGLPATPLLLTSCNHVVFVDRVEIVNHTEFTANVDVRGESGEWLRLTTVEADDTNEVSSVIDEDSRT